MAYMFKGTTHLTVEQMLDALVQHWLADQGMDTVASARQFLGTATDAALAADCIDELGLDNRAGLRSHMGRHGYGTADLEEAFSRLRQDLGAPMIARSYRWDNASANFVSAC
jgi:hypothetical protein